MEHKTVTGDNAATCSCGWCVFVEDPRGAAREHLAEHTPTMVDGAVVGEDALPLGGHDGEEIEETEGATGGAQ